MVKNIIREDISLTMDEYKGLKKYFYGNLPFFECYKHFNGYDYEVHLKGINNNLIQLTVYSNSTQVIYEEIYSKISHLIGVKRMSHQLNYKKNIIFININKEYDNIEYPLKSEFHKSKANILIWNIENNKENIFNEIVYADFTKDEALMVAGYSLLLNPDGIYTYDKSCKLFYDKLDFIGIDAHKLNELIDFSNKEEIINKLGSCTSSKSVILILLGLIEYLRIGSVLWDVQGVPNKNELPTYDIYNRYFWLVDNMC